jgi:hypothetical protein
MCTIPLFTGCKTVEASRNKFAWRDIQWPVEYWALLMQLFTPILDLITGLDLRRE